MFRFTTAPKGPEFTARMLLTDITSPEQAETLRLKPFTHFTLACTLENEDPIVSESFEQLADFLGGPASFKAEEVVNFGSDDLPLWVVKLHLGAQEEQLRSVLGKLFDPIMCPERNGTLYLWNPAPGQDAKCPHITIGSKKEDKELASKLVAQRCEFIFDQVDYKKGGPNDPHLSRTLSAHAPIASCVTANM